MSNTQQTLTALATEEFGSRVSYYGDKVARAAAAIDANPTRENVESVVRRETSGLGVNVPQSFYDKVFAAITADASETVAEDEAVVYLSDAQVTALREAAQRNGAPSNRVEAILADSGLIEPEPEPEVVEDEEPEVSEKFSAKVRAVLKSLGIVGG